MKSTCVFCRVLLVKAVDVEDVVPDEVLVGGMVFKGEVVLLECGSLNAADEAEVFHIILDFLALVS